MIVDDPSNVSKDDKTVSRLVWGAVALSCLVIGGVGVSALLFWSEFVSMSPNEWGDLIAGLSSSLAFIWLVSGFYLQRHEISRNTAALSRAAHEQKRTADSMEQREALMRAELEVAKSQLNQVASQEHGKMLAAQPKPGTLKCNLMKETVLEIVIPNDSPNDGISARLNHDGIEGLKVTAKTDTWTGRERFTVELQMDNRRPLPVDGLKLLHIAILYTDTTMVERAWLFRLINLTKCESLGFVDDGKRTLEEMIIEYQITEIMADD